MIRFDCQCGKSLKAPPKLAGSVVRCPICAAYVAIPHPLAGHDVAAKSAEVYALAEVPTAANDAALQPAFVPETKPRAPFRRDCVDSWFEASRGVRFVAGMSGALAFLTALGFELYPPVLHAGFEWFSGIMLALAWGIVVAVVAGYGCKYLDAVLEREMRGGGNQTEPPDLDPGPALMSFVKWASCFVAGPAFLFYEALRFWLSCGDMTILNALVLAELAVPALCYWLVGVLVVNSRPELSVPSPWQVLKAVRRLGLRAVLSGVVVTVAAGIHLWLAVNALVLLHTSWLAGLMLLWICWFSVWQCGALAARTLGAWQAGAQQTEAQAANYSAAA